MAYVKKEVKQKPGPKVTEPGQTYRVWLRPSVQQKIIERNGSLTNALLLQFALENKKDKKVAK